MADRARRDQQPARVRRNIGVVFAALALLGVLALAVIPATAWLDQREERAALRADEAALMAENAGLRAHVDMLGSDAEIERLARQYNLVKPGEEQYFILPKPGTPTTKPPAPAAPSAPSSPEAGRSRSLWDRITSAF